MKALEKQVKKYLDYCEKQKRLSGKTLKAYRIDLDQFIKFLHEQNYDDDKKGIEKYISWLHQQFKTKTVKRKIACVKTFFNYLEFEEQILTNPFLRIKTKFREPSVLPKIISLDEIQNIFKAAYNELHQETQTEFQRKTSLKNIAVLELLFAIGVRVSELCYLTKADVDLKNGEIKINGKGAKERIIQIGNPDVLKILNQYYNNFKNQTALSGYFFVNKFNNRLSEQSVRTIINRYAEKCGLKINITPHMFRHTFATLLLEEDVDIRYIQKFLGHSSIVTTQIYTHVTSKKQKQILSDKHPRNKLNFTKG